MSEDVSYRGKLVVVAVGSDEVTKKFKELCNNRELPEEYNNYYDFYVEEFEFYLDDEKYYYNSEQKVLFEIVEKKQIYENFHVIEAEPGVYEYTVSYYNGGCGFGEALDDSFENSKTIIKNNK